MEQRVGSRGNVLCAVLPIIAQDVFVHISRKTCNMSVELSYLVNVTSSGKAPRGDVLGGGVVWCSVWWLLSFT